MCEFKNWTKPLKINNILTNYKHIDRCYIICIIWTISIQTVLTSSRNSPVFSTDGTASQLFTFFLFFSFLYLNVYYHSSFTAKLSLNKKHTNTHKIKTHYTPT